MKVYKIIKVEAHEEKVHDYDKCDICKEQVSSFDDIDISLREYGDHWEPEKRDPDHIDFRLEIYDDYRE